MEYFFSVFRLVGEYMGKLEYLEQGWQEAGF